MSVTKEEIEKLLDKKLAPIAEEQAKTNNILNKISSDLAQIRRDLGYDNLKILKSDDKEEM